MVLKSERPQRIHAVISPLDMARVYGWGKGPISGGTAVV